MKKLNSILIIFVLSVMQVPAQNSGNSQNNDFIHEKVYIADVASGEIAKSVMLESKGLSFNHNTSSGSHITSFKMTLVTKENESVILEFENEKSGELTRTMRDAIENAPSGSKVYFKDIKYVDATNVIHIIHAADFILK